jgi:Tfp pilus assembly protein PilN
MSSPNQLSFLPDDYLETKRQRRTNVVCAALFLGLMAAIGTAFSYIEKELRGVEKTHGEVSRQYAEAAKNIEQVKQMQDKQRKMGQQAELAASLLEKVPRSFILAELTNSMPAGVSLMDVKMESKVRSKDAPAGGKTQYELKRAAMEASTGRRPAAPAPQAKEYDVSIRVLGIADNDVQVAQFMAKLNTSQLLQDVNLVISDEFEVSNHKMRRFEIEMSLNPSAVIQPGTVPVKNNARVSAD